ncbi:hypothetical protein IAU60_000937 [Kwoniella sp. DSM 27419]
MLRSFPLRNIGSSSLLASHPSTKTVFTVPSTPPLASRLPSGSAKGNTFPSPFTPLNTGIDQQQFGSDQQADPGGLGGGEFRTSGDPWAAFNNFSSPPSPSTITSTSDSQPGGECFPPSESGADVEASGSGSSRRQNLSLNISTLPTPFQGVNIQSPGSLASSGAPFTDSFTSAYTVDFGQDYFQFADGSFSSTGEGSLVGQVPAVAQQAAANHRLPASQPSSPVRGVYTLPFGAQAGRQRGATFSGGFYQYDQNGTPLFPQQMPQAIPPHLTFTTIQSPSHSLAPSPIISASPAQLQGDNGAYFSTQNTQLGSQEIHMEDVSLPGSAQQSLQIKPSLSRKSSHNKLQQSLSMTPDRSSEMLDQLSLLDKIVSSAQSAKDALLRGEQVEVSASLGDINHQLEIASELGVGPAPTHRDGETLSSQSVSPVNNFANSPTIQQNINQTYPNPMMHTFAPQLQSMPMTMQPQGLLPSLPVEPTNRSVQPNTATAMSSSASMMAAPPSQHQQTAADFLSAQTAPPPLVHSHSFPNGHQLPSQAQGTMPPSTPIVPSPSFIATIGVQQQHAPIVSSPLAIIPPSRPPSPPRYPMPAQAWETEAQPMENSAQQIHQQIMAAQGTVPVPPGIMLERRPSQSERADGRPIARGRSASVNKQWGHPTMTQSVPPSAWQSRQGSPDDDDDDSEEEGPRKTKRRRSSAGADGPSADQMNGAAISEDIRRQLDQIFEEFLTHVCSDLEMADSKGEKLHQVLMPKKMQRLDESTDYRPFKFRIQAFTNAFTEELQRRGITEETMSVKKIKMYLWKQDLISRFNPDGKKAKSKGNHIWNVDAKKLPGGGWVFRPFQRRIIGQPNPYALVNQRYEWEPRIWDPQAASDTIKPTFHSPVGSLPPWLQWEDGTKLVGVPDQATGPINIPIIADFVDGSGNPTTLETTFVIQVVPHLMPISETAAMYAQAGYVPVDFPDAQAAPMVPMAMLAQGGMPFNGGMMYPQPGVYPNQ